VATMMKERQIKAEFDRRADVLYLSLGQPRPDEGEDKDQGIVLRFGVPDDKPSGVTVVGYVEFGWSKKSLIWLKLRASTFPFLPMK
jgi:hypothetical protein